MSIKGSALVILVTAIAIKVGPLLFRKRLAPHFDGSVSAGFEKVELAFRANFESGWESAGAAFAVYHRGEKVVDLWGGYADPEANRKWAKDTLTCMFSTSKALCSLCVAIAVDRGWARYDDLVIKYWPEFAQEGKDNVTIQMLVEHKAGLAAVDKYLTLDLIKDRKALGAILAGQKPLWPPGTGKGYHALTHGWLIDQLIERVDPQHRTMAQFLRDELAVPYELDIYIGVPLSLWHRTSRLVSAGILQALSLFRIPDFLSFQFSLWKALSTTDSLLTRSTNTEISDFSEIAFNRPETGAELSVPAANGYGTARDMAKLFSLVSEMRIIKSDLVQALAKPTDLHTLDLALNLNTSAGHGFLHTKSPQGNWQFGSPGYGGQNLKVDITEELAMVYLTNGLGADMGDFSLRLRALTDAVYDSLR